MTANLFDALQAACDQVGISFKEVPVDGQWHPTGVDGDDGAGRIKLFLDGEGGIAYNWKWAEHKTFFVNNVHFQSDEERAEHERRCQEAILQAEKEAAAAQACAAVEAQREWAKCAPASENDYYLRHKGVKPHGVRRKLQRTPGEIADLVIPVRVTGGAIQSLQFIRSDGKKRFLPGGKVAGGYFGIGSPESATVLCIAEGFATGASIHEATGYPVAVAFNAGNLMAVAKTMRDEFPAIKLILCADDDFQTEGNPGLAKAAEAARAVGGLLAVPDFGAAERDGGTDFNDLARLSGTEAVRAAVAAAGPAREGTADAGAQGEESVERHSYGGGEFMMLPSGVHFMVPPNPPVWICSPLHVRAKTRDAKSGAWGRLLEWRDDDGVTHQWPMPMELLQGDGVEVRRELAGLGLAIAPGKKPRELLAAYLQVWPVENRARCVERLGWHGAVYVTPGESVGENGEIVVFQNAQAIEPAFSAAGTVEEWRDAVGHRAAGSSRLAFALSVAFAGPLAEVAGEESGGFHFRGPSSTGKSTALKAAASVWGRPDAYLRAWRATTNGLEGLAALHNDGLLVLDELSQVDCREAGEAAYMLANGQGKARASRTGAVRRSANWRLLYLSAGEESLAALMQQAGRKPNAGQEVRLVEIDADAGTGFGLFETLHDQATPAALALALKDAAAKYHGAVGTAWLRCIVADRATLAERITAGIRDFVAEEVKAGADGQVERVGRKFGLVAVAGELATEYGLTGWQKGDATEAARKCFAAWLEGFGGVGRREDRALFAQVRAFFEAHGASRFEPLEGCNVAVETKDGDMPVPDHKRPVHNRVGFVRTGDDGRPEFLVLPEAFRTEVCKGFDAAAKTLVDAGWIERGSGDHITQQVRTPLGKIGLYVFTAKWASEK